MTETDQMELNEALNWESLGAPDDNHQDLLKDQMIPFEGASRTDTIELPTALRCIESERSRETTDDASAEQESCPSSPMSKMSDDDLASSPPAVQPVVLSMEVDDDDSFESYYRLRLGTQVKYVTISPGTFDRDTLSFPVPSLPRFPDSEEWTIAHLSRDETSGELKTSVSSPTRPSIHQWHQTRVHCLDLEKTKSLTPMVFEAVSHSTILPSDTMIAKIAHFEWEMPRMEQETRAYQLLECSGLAPRFLGHIHENGRVMGFLLEKLEERSAPIQDLDACETALGKLHELGLLHGDDNQYNFLVTEEGVKLLDFEHAEENASPESMCEELEHLRVELVDESGRGGGCIFRDDSD